VNVKAVIRADTSSTIGSGHLARCLTLGVALRSRGVDQLVVATTLPNPNTHALASRAHAEVVALDSANDRKEMLGLVDDASIVVVDSYTLESDYEDALRGKGRVVCVLDDLGERPVRGDILLNGNFFAGDLNYRVGQSGARLLLGPSYALLREEFLVARSDREKRAAHTGRQRLFVTMGGADPTRETEKVLDALVGLDLETRIAVGGGNPRSQEIQSRAANMPNVEILPNPYDMGKHMGWCDFALSAAGSTCLELACVGVVTAVIAVARNQEQVAAAVERLGLMVNLGRSEGVGADEIASCIQGLAQSSSVERRELERKQRTVVDGQGSARVAEALLGG
jgi:UDP-2,4-diacetamido-2,4,6-trideoxy-beta-L-altropyranose hydrolase